MTILKKTTFGLILVLLVLGISLQSCKKDEITEIVGVSVQAVQFNAAMRVLWSDHATWTRDVIHGILDENPDANAALNRLLRNQVDIGNAINPYYGDAGGNQLTALLTEHIVIAGAILVAARDGNTADFNTANAQWYQNGDDISVFLNTANPENWDLNHMKGHMKDHLDMTLAEAVAHLEGRHDDEIQTYDDVFEQLMHLADQLSDGIIAQFPAQF
jgi:hypothetical protein